MTTEGGSTSGDLPPHIAAEVRVVLRGAANRLAAEAAQAEKSSKAEAHRVKVIGTPSPEAQAAVQRTLDAAARDLLEGDSRLVQPKPEPEVKPEPC